MKNIYFLIILSILVLTGECINAQTKLDTLVNNRKLLLDSFQNIPTGQKLDSAFLSNISTLFNSDNFIIDEAKALENKLKIADSTNLAVQNMDKIEAVKAKKLHQIMLISGGGLALLFVVFLLLFIITKIKLNKRGKELKQVKKTYDTNIKEKSEYEQSLLKDIQNLTNGYKNLELKITELEKEKQNIISSEPHNVNITDNHEKEELLKKINEFEINHTEILNKYNEVSKINKELDNKSNDLALKNIELSEKIKNLEDEISKKDNSLSQLQSQKVETMLPESQKVLDNIDINMYKIEKLNKLKDASAITIEEYESLKQTILSKI